MALLCDMDASERRCCDVSDGKGGWDVLRQGLVVDRVLVLLQLFAWC